MSDDDKLRYEAEKEAVDEAYDIWYDKNQYILALEFCGLYPDHPYLDSELFKQYCTQQWNEFNSAIRSKD